MQSTTFIVLGLVALIVVVLGFIGYALTTGKIIREQEKEIADLKRKLRRETILYNREKSLHKEPLYIERDGKNPMFGGF